MVYRFVVKDAIDAYIFAEKDEIVKDPQGRSGYVQITLYNGQSDNQQVVFQTTSSSLGYYLIRYTLEEFNNLMSLEIKRNGK